MRYLLSLTAVVVGVVFFVAVAVRIVDAVRPSATRSGPTPEQIAEAERSREESGRRTADLHAAAPAPVAGPTLDEQRATATENAQQFIKVVSKAKDGLFVRAVINPDLPGELRITISNRWHYQPKPIRLQTVQALWQLWAGIQNPSNPDRARIELLDAMGNKVGGSRVWGGSLVYVED